MVKVEYFSEGKIQDRNEDFFGYSDSVFVVADGATDKSGRLYNGQTGAEIASRLAVETCLSADSNGAALISLLNQKIADKYKEFKIEEKVLDSPMYRFSCGLVLARVIDGEAIITQIGDVGFRINGKQIYQNISPLDRQAADKRATYFEQTNDSKAARAHVLPFILAAQKQHQNNPDSQYGYGLIDGTDTPEKYVKMYKFDSVKTIEIFSDGYFDVPQEASLKAWEDKFKEIEILDPYKVGLYKSTKVKDDRTVMIINLNSKE